MSAALVLALVPWALAGVWLAVEAWRAPLDPPARDQAEHQRTCPACRRAALRVVAGGRGRDPRAVPARPGVMEVKP